MGIRHSWDIAIYLTLHILTLAFTLWILCGAWHPGQGDDGWFDTPLWLSVGLSSFALLVIPTDLVLTAKSRVNHLRVCLPLYVLFELAWLTVLIVGFAPKKGSRSVLRYLVENEVGLPPHYTDESYSNGFFGECTIVLVIFVCVILLLGPVVIYRARSRVAGVRQERVEQRQNREAGVDEAAAKKRTEGRMALFYEPGGKAYVAMSVGDAGI